MKAYRECTKDQKGTYLRLKVNAFAHGRRLVSPWMLLTPGTTRRYDAATGRPATLSK